MKWFSCIVFAALPLAPLAAHAQRGDERDAPGFVQVDPIPIDKIPPPQELLPADAIKAFKIQPGFKIECVASEPLVQDPIAIKFAPDGRIWVVEMTAYMPNVDGVGEDKPAGKIVILESSHHDGHYDIRKVFVDGLVLPRAVALVHDGVLVGEPPHLWYYPLLAGDKPGKRVEIANDYGSDYNPQNTANTLLWDLDNWIYSGSYTKRFRYTEDGWITGATTRRGEYGLTEDDYGRLVYNSNEDQFRIDLVPSEYITRNPDYRHALGLNVDPIHDQTVWPIHPTPGVNRGYWKDILRPDGTLAKTTAACGPLIYRGDNFPAEFRGNAFVCEPAGNLVIRDILVETNGTMTGYEAYKHEDFLASTDERFRPVSLINGPDGAMYLVDFHRGLLEHRLSVTTYLRRQIKARKLEMPQHYGRIYRITYGETNNPALETLAQLGSEQLVPKLDSLRGWVQDTAQQLIVERNNPNVLPLLKMQAVTATNPVTQIHTAWTLDGLGQMDEGTLFALMTNANGKVRATGIRLSKNRPGLGGNSEFGARLFDMAKNDLDADVQLQLGFAFGYAPHDESQRGLKLVATQSASMPLVREAIITSAYPSELEMARQFLSLFKEKEPGCGSLISGLAECVVNTRDTNKITAMLDFTATAQPWQQKAILEGIGARNKMKKIYFPAEPAGLAKMKSEPELGMHLAKISQLLTWPGQPGYVPPPYVPPLTADEQKRYDLGHTLFSATCAACHQPTGLGAAGVAPPLVDSEWVLGSQQRLCRIVLQGAQGPIRAAGVHFDSTMPSWGSFNDEQLAGILTYIRRDWGQGATPVEIETVKNIRAATIKHDGAWTQAELTKIP